MVDIRVVVVDPIYPENLGYIARAIGNFEGEELVRVRGCEVTGKARERATHSIPVLEASRRVETLDEALDGVGLAIGATARRTEDPKAHHRETLTPIELREHLEGVEGTVALVLGREDKGLDNEELARMDLAVAIPAPGKKSLNIGHAAAVLLYALNAQGEGRRLEETEGRPLAGQEELSRLHAAFEQLLDAIDHPDHQRFRATSMFRRLVGRAAPSTWEFHRLMGVLTQTLRRLGQPFEEE